MTVPQHVAMKVPNTALFRCCGMVVLLLFLTGCTVHQATESDMARWHGFLESERVKSAELTPLTRCYQRGNGPIKCYDTAWENSEKRLFHE